MFSSIVVIVVIGGSIAIVAFMTVGADNQGATSKNNSHDTDSPETSALQTPLPEPIPSPEPIPAPSVQRTPPSTQSHTPSETVSTSFSDLLLATATTRVTKSKSRGISRLLGAVGGYGLLIAISFGVSAIILMVILSFLVDV